MQLRWILTAAAATLALAGCSDGKDTAKADPTPSPTTVATSETPSPTPSPTPTTTAPANPFPGIAMTFTGGNASDPRVAAIKTFVAGSAYAWTARQTPAELRVALNKDLQRVIASGIAKAKANNWTVSPRPIVHLESLEGSGKKATAHLCRWNPSVDWRRKSDNVNVQNTGRRWQDLKLTLVSTGQGWQVASAADDGTCARKAP
ncbi:hypothetical protein [Mumia sp. Pv 4-285]|uniref:hypothetical protein n=1 Tax=Mumia qirimensis TaxID=3234852 RepID=UPI00351D8878